MPGRGEVGHDFDRCIRVDNKKLKFCKPIFHNCGMFTMLFVVHPIIISVDKYPHCPPG